ncbi:hypothetical protein D3C78_746340 [compost metagenome]
MLGGAAVVGAKLAIALTLGETLRVDQEEVRLGTQAGRPVFQQLALAPQFIQQLFGQAGRMAYPQVHVAVLGLGQRAQAAHQEQAMDRPRRVAMAGLVGERAGKALGLDYQVGAWLVARYAGGGAAGDIARQQRVVHMKQQRQQRQHLLLARRQALQGPLQPALVEPQEARTQCRQDFAVDAFVQVGADFVGVVHCALGQASGAVASVA